MADTTKLTHISARDLDAVLDRAHTEHWDELVLLGLHPDNWRFDYVENWPDHVKTAYPVFQLSEIVDGLADRIRPLTNLTSLNLSFNNIGVDGAKAIATLTNLKSLNLSSCFMGNGGAKAIATLPYLTSLNLSYSSIGNDDAKAIAALTNLTSLYLKERFISEDGARAIATLTNLTSLDLAGNHIGEDGASAIAATLTNLTSLDLAGNHIGEDGASAIAATLTHLTSLDLQSNRIGDNGANAIAKLSNLTSLNLAGNSIGKDGAKAIAKLSNLTSLNLSSNSIGVDGAKAIATLDNLTSLNLRGNGIGVDGAKAIATLDNLTSLNLGWNSIGDDGAKAITTLDNLTSLGLRSNSIGMDGIRAILEAWATAPYAQRLQYLDLGENGDLGDLLPPEVLATTDAQAILAAYRRYRVAKTRPLSEAKLLVVGNEAVGKTSLLRYLIENKPRDPNEKKTPGIATHEKIDTQTWSPDKPSEEHNISLNVWDFGGQEMMRGTHRFFLTERSLYLLVLEDRRQDDEPVAENWLKTILNRGGESPIIVVINKSDGGKQDLRLNETGLQKTYPNIVGFLRTSCEPDDWAKDSMVALRELIATTVAGHPQLTHVRDGFPEAYLRIKTAITDMARERLVLSFRQFEQLCEQGQNGAETVTDPAEQRALLRLLHDLGTVVAHGLERDAPAAIRGVTLLDPNWLTGAIYTLLNQPEVRDQQGEFERSQLELWLDPNDYPPEHHEFILEMMQNRDIGLCFRLPDTADERYLIPDALPANEPDYDIWPHHSLRFRYYYAFLPQNLIPRFIVQANRNLTEKKTRWRTGAVLSAVGCRVLIKGDPYGKQIDIAVDGPQGMRRSALNIILDHLDFVHKLNPECGPRATVPLPTASVVTSATTTFGNWKIALDRTTLSFPRVQTGITPSVSCSRASAEIKHLLSRPEKVVVFAIAKPRRRHVSSF